MTTKDWLIARLREPTTALSIAGFLATLGVTADAGLVQGICYGLAGAFTLAGAIMREKAS